MKNSKVEKAVLVGALLIAVIVGLVFVLHQRREDALQEMREQLFSSSADDESKVSEDPKPVAERVRLNDISIEVPDNYKIEEIGDYFDEIGAARMLSKINYDKNEMPMNSCDFQSIFLIDIDDKYQDGGIIGNALLYLGRFCDVAQEWTYADNFTIKFNEPYLNLGFVQYTNGLECYSHFNLGGHNTIWWRGPNNHCYMIEGKNVPMDFVKNCLKTVQYHTENNSCAPADDANKYFRLEQISCDPSKNEIYFDLTVRDTLDDASKERIDYVLDQKLGAFLRDNAEIVDCMGGVTYRSRIYDRSWNYITTFTYNFTDRIKRTPDEYVPWIKKRDDYNNQRRMEKIKKLMEARRKR